MPVSICTQKEFLTESKLNGFFGVLLLLLDFAVPLLPWFTHGGLYLLLLLLPLRGGYVFSSVGLCLFV